MADRDLKMEGIGEFEFIRSIKEGCLLSPEDLIMGIGDDCAVIGPFGDKVLLVTTDLLVENIHFILEDINPEHLGQKAVAVNLSDVAAMGGNARHAFVSLAIPQSMTVAVIHALYRGIKSICSDYKVNIVGGDTSASAGGLMISVTVIGESPEKEVLYRSGAGLGDLIYVTGTLGDSAAGLKVIKQEVTAPVGLAVALKKAHNLPFPFLDAGRTAAESGLASAMIDLSDGLLSDLRHICESSGVGALLYSGALPLSKELLALAEINNFDPYELALSGGEDYRLLITVPPENADSFQRQFERGKPCDLYYVGKITEGEGIKMIRPDGMEERLEVKGYDHFLRSGSS